MGNRAVEPRTLRGFRDIMPEEMLSRERIISTVRKVYESYGFVPLATPTLEYLDILTSGGEDDTTKEMYKFVDPDENEVGLNFELTVSLARVYAQYPDLPRPFKRYQIQSAFRFDKPDPGRYREFLQFDIDTVGSSSMAADAEIISVMHDSLSSLGVDFKIRVNNRKLLSSLIRFAGLSDDMAYPVLRIVDKLDKQGLDAVKLELGQGRVDQSGAKIAGLGIAEDKIDGIVRFLNLPKVSRCETLDELRAYFSNFGDAGEGLDELEQIHKFLDAAGIGDDRVVIDMSIARGLTYYTGPVFETLLTGAESYGSVMSGGRYDKRIGQFSKEDVPATGASMGVDRLLAAMQFLKKIKTRPSIADVLVTTMDRNYMAEYQKIAQSLRHAGLITELYVGDTKNIKRQLKYADKQQIPIAILAGSNEFESNEVTVKDLRVIKEEQTDFGKREEYLQARVAQKTIAMNHMVSYIKELLSTD